MSKKLGMARHIGVSNFTVALIEEAGRMRAPSPLACDQVEYHPYLDQTKVLEAVRASRHGCGRLQSGGEKAEIKNDQTLARIGQSPRQEPPRRSACAGWCSRMFSAIPRTVADRAAVGEYRHLRFRAVARRDAPDIPDGKRQKPGSPITVFAPKWD